MTDRERWDELRALHADFEGCGDHSCKFKMPAGMATNGGCRCPRNLMQLHRLSRLFAAIPDLLDALEESETMRDEWKAAAHVHREGSNGLERWLEFVTPSALQGAWERSKAHYGVDPVGYARPVGLAAARAELARARGLLERAELTLASHDEVYGCKYPVAADIAAYLADEVPK